jgi:hypothetical protein
MKKPRSTGLTAPAPYGSSILGERRTFIVTPTGEWVSADRLEACGLVLNVADVWAA